MLQSDSPRRDIVRLRSVDVPILRAPSAWVPVGALGDDVADGGVDGCYRQQTERRRSMTTFRLPPSRDMDLLMDLEFVAWLDTDNVDAG